MPIGKHRVCQATLESDAVHVVNPAAQCLKAMPNPPVSHLNPDMPKRLSRRAVPPFPRGQVGIALGEAVEGAPAHPFRFHRLAEQVVEVVAQLAPQRPALRVDSVNAPDALRCVVGPWPDRVTMAKLVDAVPLVEFQRVPSGVGAYEIPAPRAVVAGPRHQLNVALNRLAVVAAANGVSQREFAFIGCGLGFVTAEGVNMTVTPWVPVPLSRRLPLRLGDDKGSCR